MFTANFYASAGCTGGDDFVRKLKTGSPDYPENLKNLGGTSSHDNPGKPSKLIRSGSNESMVEFQNLQ